MTIHDCVGIEFPIDEEIFKSNVGLRGLIKNIEDKVEIQSDLEEVAGSLRSLNAMLQRQETLMPTLGYKEYFYACESIVGHATVMYAKAFNSNPRRKRLSSNKYFRDAPERVLSAHNFFINLRNKYFSHAEASLNAHKLHVLPGKFNSCPIVSPGSQVTRAVMATSYNWVHLIEAAEIIIGKLKAEIYELCKDLEQLLTDEQIAVINSKRRY